jgi:hypothetical protein
MRFERNGAKTLSREAGEMSAKPTEGDLRERVPGRAAGVRVACVTSTTVIPGRDPGTPAREARAVDR